MRTIIVLTAIAGMLFGAPVSVWFGPAASTDTNGIYWNLLSFIDSATNSIRGAVYEIDLVSIAERFAGAARRGVRVELCIEAKTLESQRAKAALSVLRTNGVKLFPDSRKTGLMHDKFLVADAARVWSGSANFTCTDMFRNYNDCVRIVSPDIASFYTDEALSLIDPVTFPPGRTREKTFSLGKDAVTVLFSPGVVSQRIGETVRRANDTIRFLTFAFSSESILASIAYAERRGVSVFGVFDNVFENPSSTRSWKTVPFRELSVRDGALVRYDTEEAKVHHKLIVIDNDAVITGSFNFSLNAERNNNENTLIIRSRRIADVYNARQAYLFDRFNKDGPSERYRELCERTIAAGKKPIPYETFTHDDAVRAMRALRGRITNRSFRCIIREVISGDTVRAEVPGIDRFVIIQLAGVTAPAVDGDGGQFPQATYARETLALLCAQKEACVVIEGENGYFSFIGDIRTERSCSEDLALSGWVLPGTNASAAVRTAASIARAESRGLWSVQYALRETPDQFRQRRYAERRTNAVVLNRERSPEENAVIGNRSTRRYYLPWTSDHARVAARISENNIVYFAHESNALAAGFVRGGR